MDISNACSLSAYICPMPVTIGVYLSNACHYRRIFVQCMSLSAYICPMPVTIGVNFAIFMSQIRITPYPFTPTPFMIPRRMGQAGWANRPRIYTYGRCTDATSPFSGELAALNSTHKTC